MRYLPAWCTDCERAMLMAENEYLAGRLNCPQCSLSLRVIPGSNFLEGDRALFQQLDQTIAAAAISPADALRFANELQAQGASSRQDDALNGLVAELRGLAPIATLLSAHPERVRAAAQMLQCIFTARAVVRRRSGFVLTTPAPESDKGNKSA